MPVYNGKNIDYKQQQKSIKFMLIRGQHTENVT